MFERSPLRHRGDFLPLAISPPPLAILGSKFTNKVQSSQVKSCDMWVEQTFLGDLHVTLVNLKGGARRSVFLTLSPLTCQNGELLLGRVSSPSACSHTPKFQRSQFERLGRVCISSAGGWPDSDGPGALHRAAGVWKGPAVFEGLFLQPWQL